MHQQEDHKEPPCTALGSNVQGDVRAQREQSQNDCVRIPGYEMMERK